MRYLTIALLIAAGGLLGGCGDCNRCDDCPAHGAQPQTQTPAAAHQRAADGADAAHARETPAQP